jgi:hypothetical protein
VKDEKTVKAVKTWFIKEIKKKKEAREKAV